MQGQLKRLKERATAFIGRHTRWAFTGAIKSGFAWFVEEGLKVEKVSKEEAEARLRVCERCPRFRLHSRTCEECGCFMDIKTKLAYDPVRSAYELSKVKTVCPIGKW